MVWDMSSIMNSVLNTLIPWAVFGGIIYLLYIPLNKLGIIEKLKDIFERAFGQRDEDKQVNMKTIAYE